MRERRPGRPGSAEAASPFAAIDSDTEETERGCPGIPFRI